MYLYLVNKAIITKGGQESNLLGTSKLVLKKGTQVSKQSKGTWEGEKAKQYGRSSSAGRGNQGSLTL